MTVSPPRPKGPPLNALRAFEAAARLDSFAAAAEELCVTPGAVAQHVKALEAWAGTDLFERRSQGVLLTAFGASLVGDFSLAFDRLGEAVQKLRTGAAPQHISIAALPSVAQLWLSPKLPAIRQAWPALTISVTALETRPNLRREPFDLSLFFDAGPAAGGAVEICRDEIFPVCSPAVAARLDHPRDLRQETFLHDSLLHGDWSAWLAQVLPGEAFDTRGPVFSLYSLALEEAQNSAGVLIGHEPLVRAALTAGTLVVPFDTRINLERRLTLEVAPSAAAGPTLTAVIETLKTSYTNGHR